MFYMAPRLTLNVERFLALTRPFFHQASVTKTRLLCFQAFWTVITVGPTLVLLHFNAEMYSNIVVAAVFPLLMLVFIYLNYEMFKIAKSKRGNERVVPTTATSMDGNRRKRILNLKNISTCYLAVSCFFVCSCPQIIFSALHLASETLLSERQFLLFHLWSSTFISLNSTFNCVIFFWRNSVLRREGMKIVNAFKRRVTNWIAINNLSGYRKS
jgi:hypothetical protein